jgi:hypothetical protein
MVAVEDFVARIEETCGDEKNFIVTFRYERKDEAISKINGRASRQKSASTIIHEMAFKGVSFRLYGSGKAIFRDVKDKKELQGILSGLLL